MGEGAEWLARFVYNRDLIRADGSVKKGVFLEKRPPHNTSVDVHGEFAKDIHWEAGRRINPARPLIGAADIAKSAVVSLGLSVLRTPSAQNPHHGEITGWDQGDDDAEKLSRIDLATELADGSVFVVAGQTFEKSAKESDQ